MADTTPPPDTAQARPNTWALLRPLILRLHFYAGVFVAPFILVAAVSGLLYVWTPQLEQALYTDQLHVEQQGEPITLQEQVLIAQEELPTGELNAVRPATTATDSTRVLFDLPELGESHRMAVFVDPYDGDVLGVMESYGTSGALPARTWIDLLHRTLHLGDVGRLYSELAASWLWAVAAGGAVMWIARNRRRRGLRRALVPQVTSSRGRARSLSVHGTIGLWALIGLFFLSATGLTWSQHAGTNITELRERLAWTTPSVSIEAIPQTPGVDLGIDRALDTARDHGLDGLVEVAVPQDSTSLYTVTQIDRSWPSSVEAVAIAPDTGEVTDTVRFEDYSLMAKLSRWGIDAHMGVLFGVPNQIVLTALALALITVVGLGYRMWWQRRPTRSSAWSLGRPYPRGSFRVLPWWLKGVVIAVVVGVGWALPLLGLSLVVFLLVDLAVGAYHRRRGSTGTPTGDAPASVESKV
ncbi:PepSY-associated TM helix domain-containing protein [Nocardiopsis sp. NPDC055551]|uniref:PepSY-associated TM helix domain-containing protein n=1 Tax=Nocardiopsis sp. NPDC006832 TaxID=3157188 RepID=UPI0033EBA55A